MSARKKLLSLEEVNGMDFQQFSETFGSVIEQTPLVATTVWSCRPFQDLATLHKAFTDFIQKDIFPEARSGIIRCYPDLAGRLAQESQLSEESTREHKAAGLLELSDSEKRELNSLNERYKEKFGFPFVVCARENKKEAVFAGLRARLGNSLQEEEKQALKEICKIAWYRLNDVVINDRSPLYKL
jgi:2-oxo-4-hydroxy-4-carboxy-5-ureidoimidazoline decarboxylase